MFGVLISLYVFNFRKNDANSLRAPSQNIYFIVGSTDESFMGGVIFFSLMLYKEGKTLFIIIPISIMRLLFFLRKKTSHCLSRNGSVLCFSVEHAEVVDSGNDVSVPCLYFPRFVACFCRPNRAFHQRFSMRHSFTKAPSGADHQQRPCVVTFSKMIE